VITLGYVCTQDRSMDDGGAALSTIGSTDKGDEDE